MLTKAVVPQPLGPQASYRETWEEDYSSPDLVSAIYHVKAEQLIYPDAGIGQNSWTLMNYTNVFC